MSTTASFGRRRRHRIVGTRAVEQVPGQKQPRTDAASRVDRLAIFNRLVRMSARAAHGRDAVDEMDAAEDFAVLLVRVAVRFDQARHHAAARSHRRPCPARADRRDAARST